MKTTIKTILLAAILSLIACKKDRTCVCEKTIDTIYNSKMQAETKSEVTTNYNGKRSECKNTHSIEVINSQNAYSVETTETCELK